MLLILAMLSLGALASEQFGIAKIMDGLPAAVGMVPYQVSIQSKKGQHFCGGSVIDEWHILTAAHCMYSNKQKTLFHRDSIQVWAGGTDRRYARFKGVMKHVANIFIHEYFNLTHAINDIAVLRIKDAFTFSSNIKPIELSSSYIRTGVCNISGWGHMTASDNFMSVSLRYTEIWIKNLTECKFDYQAAEITKYMICAGDRSNMRDSCKGDSGGPLVCNDKLEGITSFGAGCSEPGSLGVYTRVLSYKHWIQLQQTRSVSSRCTNTIIFMFICTFTFHTIL